MSLQPTVLLLVAAASAIAQVPRQYDVAVFENDSIRVHMVILNTVGRFHAVADAPQLLYCFGPVTLQGDTGIDACAKDQVVFIPPGSVDLRASSDPRPEVLIAEVKRPPSGDFVSRQDEATRAAPDAYRVLFENDVVRVIRFGMKPGQRTKVHWQAGSDFLYPLTTARIRSTSPIGSARDIELRARVPRWTAGETRQALENTGTTDALAILIELK
jgi:hypothetical protein